jgi:hypothetical protein
MQQGYVADSLAIGFVCCAVCFIEKRKQIKQEDPLHSPAGVSVSDTRPAPCASHIAQKSELVIGNQGA